MKISTKLIEYILLICEENEFSAVTKNNTLLLISKYIKSRGSNYSEDTQMVGLVALNLSQKLYESGRDTLDLVYLYSRHNYKHCEIVMLEEKMLVELEY